MAIHQAETALGDEALRAFLSERGMIPSEDAISIRENIFAQLKTTIEELSLPDGVIQESSHSPVRKAFSLLLVPVGAYGLGVWHAESPIDLLCIGSINLQSFFTILQTRLLSRKSEEGSFKIISVPKKDPMEAMQLERDGVRINIQYCAAVKTGDKWPSIRDGSEDHLYDNFLYDEFNKMDACLRIDKIKTRLPDLDVLIQAHRFLSLWTRVHGLQGERLGYLGDLQIFNLLLATLFRCERLGQSKITPTWLIYSLFSYLSELKTTELEGILIGPNTFMTCTDGQWTTLAFKYSELAKEDEALFFTPVPLDIPWKFPLDLKQTVTFKNELMRAQHQITKGLLSWTDLVCHPVSSSLVAKAEGEAEFLSIFPYYVQFEFQHWGASRESGLKALEWTESQTLRLLQALHWDFEIQCRFWPAKFEVVSNKDNENQSLDCRYLIGLGTFSPADGTVRRMGRTRVQAVKETVEQTNEQMSRHKGRPKGDYLIIVSLIGRITEKLRSIDDRRFAKSAEFFEDKDAEQGLGNDEDNRVDRKQKKTAQRLSNPSLKSSAKLRPAIDVINRLKWDRSFNSDDFLVGYEDRFLGVKEIPLASWQSEETDEMFIPQHRIMYFKRHSDQALVWDRESRLDNVFGSGLKAAC